MSTAPCPAQADATQESARFQQVYRDIKSRIARMIVGQDEVAEGPYGMNRGASSVGPRGRP